VRFAQEIRRESTDGPLLVDARVRAACVDVRSLKPRPLPDALIEELTR
jgi:acyl-CoA thioesterase FadM